MFYDCLLHNCGKMLYNTALSPYSLRANSSKYVSPKFISAFT